MQAKTVTNPKKTVKPLLKSHKALKSDAPSFDGTPLSCCKQTTRKPSAKIMKQVKIVSYERKQVRTVPMMQLFQHNIV